MDIPASENKTSDALWQKERVLTDLRPTLPRFVSELTRIPTAHNQVAMSSLTGTLTCNEGLGRVVFLVTRKRKTKPMTTFCLSHQLKEMVD